jgi:hypothetical protein
MRVRDCAPYLGRDFFKPKTQVPEVGKEPAHPEPRGPQRMFGAARSSRLTLGISGGATLGGRSSLRGVTIEPCTI